MTKKSNKIKPKTKTTALEEFDIVDSDENFAFIAGYTSNGFPYGLTHEEMAELEKQNENIKLQFNYL